MASTTKERKSVGCISWIKLILAVVPSVVFGVFTVVFTIQQNSLSQSTLELDRQQAVQQRMQSIFENCIDTITNVLISANFNGSNPLQLGPIREKVLAALRHVDAVYKRDIIFFLYTNGLIRRDKASEYRLDLSGADLHGVQFIKSETMDCDLQYVYLRNVRAFDAVFSDCHLLNADFSGSVMNRSRFYKNFIPVASFVNADLTEAVFIDNAFYAGNFSGATLSKAIFFNNKGFASIDFTNANLFESSISDPDLLGTLPTGNFNTNVLINTWLPNGAFLVERSQLLINYGAEEKVCYLHSNLTEGGSINL